MGILSRENAILFLVFPMNIELHYVLFLCPVINLYPEINL